LLLLQIKVQVKGLGLLIVPKKFKHTGVGFYDHVLETDCTCGFDHPIKMLDLRVSSDVPVPARMNVAKYVSKPATLAIRP